MTAPSTAIPAGTRARGTRPATGLITVAVVVAAAFALPGGYVAWRVLTASGNPLGLLAERRTLDPLWRTVQLATLVAVAAAVLGTGLAWLAVRTDLPGRRFWRIALPLPLVYPSFVGAAAFISGLTPGGIVHDVFGAASEKDRDTLGVRAACNEDHIRLANLALLDLGCASQVFRG